MRDADSHERERELGERIANRMRSIGHGPSKPVTEEEQKKLKAAASRLDQMLNAAADADRQALKKAALRLDELLLEIGKRKDVSDRLKRREPR